MTLCCLWLDTSSLLVLTHLTIPTHISRTTFELATMNYTFGLFAFLALLGTATMTLPARVALTGATDPAATQAVIALLASRSFWRSSRNSDTVWHFVSTVE
ncbi:hypothetical protein C8J55DRAFT_548078 [Lentinula edodes]|uniref:Uncharacterized protein n=1 Tax=Lentinula lateritia TaxID=40482 RepID=A0A9W9API4_9AGAR|nr:hypothetical protein C8J55DRAFT_548078 [Lentinula edodes]